MEPVERIVPLRLQKFLARAGVASRRGSEDLMTAGRVTVNGEPVFELGSKIDPSVDVVAVDGKVVEQLGSGPVYLMLHKPVGYITTMSDPHGRETVASLVPVDEYPGLFPVGRLDRDSSGLLLFTTDGELAHRVLHPKWKVLKSYLVTVHGQVTDSDIEMLRDGVPLDDGMTAPAEVEVLYRRQPISTMILRIREGRKRQVRRMCSAIRHPVKTLHRTDFGPITLGALDEGKHRHLTAEEVGLLRNLVADSGDDEDSNVESA